MGFFSDFNFEGIKIIVQGGWQDLAGTDFHQIKYSEPEFAIKIGVVLCLLILLKKILALIGWWLGWENYSRKDSGHFISKTESYLLARFILAIPTLTLALPLLAVVFAIANPYFAVTREEKIYIETRTRIELQDVSSSMAEQFQKTGKSKGEIASNAHLKFLEMRKGKKDRTAFWLFSNDPYPIQEDFIIDDEAYYFKVYDAPWELGSSDTSNWTEEQWKKYVLPKSRYLQVAGQGGTVLSGTLKAAISTFDADAKKQKLSSRSGAGRSILIITDAAISDLDNVRFDFEEISKRGIRPYIIFIDDSNGEENLGQLASIPALLQEVIARGGKYFSVSDENSLDRAYQEIDKLEKTRVEIVKKSLKIPAFQKFIFLAILALIVIIPLGLVTYLSDYP